MVSVWDREVNCPILDEQQISPSGANGDGHYIPQVCLALRSRLPPAFTNAKSGREKGRKICGEVNA